ncbi:olfactory receptor 10A7-like [Ictidomys tridecemlineatus]|uniref:olfactory receptor 10A7-like n=1 Tax=Ictidomys tridecemlineatus TaxID=43179 RepID=UPI00038C53A8|nr:olfactory receptor 10A7-like [Ictidomys tridecemlineatus]KAG3255560.1 olfactory receptor 10A7-like [Ictidomys tridecemlineatus]
MERPLDVWSTGRAHAFSLTTIYFRRPVTSARSKVEAPQLTLTEARPWFRAVEDSPFLVRADTDTLQEHPTRVLKENPGSVPATAPGSPEKSTVQPGFLSRPRALYSWPMPVARTPPGGPAALAWANQSGARDFVLLGFAHVPRLRPLLTALFLALFLLALLGNTLIALLPGLDPALRAPMYFFLRQLALVELCFSLDVAPRLLLTLLRPGRGVSPAACALQLVLSCVTSECFLLTAMAWDRFVAICRPLHYGALVSLRRCRLLATACWLAGVPVALVFTAWLFSFPFCGPRGIRHFFCDIAPLLSLVCADTRVFEANVLAATVLVIIIPFCLIATSYARILPTVLRMPSASGRLKALSTCASHLIVVILFYGTTGVIHLRPKASYSPESKQVVSLSYTLVTPMLNPLIYSLRNKEVKAALGRLCGQRRGPHFP